MTAIQLIANLVVTRADGRVLLVRPGDEERWWLPGADLEEYEHPDEAARRVLRGLGLAGAELSMKHVDSFRGRRGWHVVFHYHARAPGEPEGDWFEARALPWTAHRPWEQQSVDRVLGG